METGVPPEEGEDVAWSCGAAAEEHPYIEPPLQQRSASPLRSSVEEPVGTEDLPPSPPPHPRVAQSSPERVAPEEPEPKGTSTSPHGARAKEYQPRTMPTDGGQSSSTMPSPEDADPSSGVKRLGWKTGLVPDDQRYRCPPPFGFASDELVRMCALNRLDTNKVVGSIDEAEEAPEWAESATIIDDFLRRLPKMVKVLQSFQEDTNETQRPNM